MFLQGLALPVVSIPTCQWNPLTRHALHALGLLMGFPGSSLHQANFLSFKTQLKGHLFWALPLRSSVREKNGMDLEQRDPGLPTNGYMPAE